MLSFGDKNDKDEVFKINRRHIAICHAAFTIIDFVLLTIYYYFQVYGTEQYEFLAHAILGFLALQIGYALAAACLDGFMEKSKNGQELDKSGYEQI